MAVSIILSALVGLFTRIESVHSDVAVVQTDTAVVKSDVAWIKQILENKDSVVLK